MKVPYNLCIDAAAHIGKATASSRSVLLFRAFQASLEMELGRYICFDILASRVSTIQLLTDVINFT